MIKEIIQIGQFKYTIEYREIAVYTMRIEMMNKAEVEAIRDFSISYSHSLNNDIMEADYIAII